MIQLIQFSHFPEFKDNLQQIYLDSFPLDERRDWQEMLQLISHPNFNLYNIIDCNESLGMISLWKWTDFTFIEHFAIRESLQGKGIGSQVMNLLKEGSSRLIMEVEEPNSELAVRRITFYKRLGFSVCEGEYYQPPYSADKNAVKMLLMSYPKAVTRAEFVTFKTKVYQEVYQWNSI